MSSNQTEIELERDEFLNEIRGEWDGAAQKHVAFVVEMNPSEDPQRLSNLLAEVALEAAHEEREEAERLYDEIERLQERLENLQVFRRSALCKARLYQAAHDELIG